MENERKTYPNRKTKKNPKKKQKKSAPHLQYPGLPWSQDQSECSIVQLVAACCSQVISTQEDEPLARTKSVSSPVECIVSTCFNSPQVTLAKSECSTVRATALNLLRFMLTWEEHCLSFQLGQAGKQLSKSKFRFVKSAKLQLGRGETLQRLLTGGGEDMPS